MTIQIDIDGPPLSEEQAAEQRRRIDRYLKDAAGGYSQEQLADAFDIVKNAEHWKNPIDAVVPRDMTDVLGRAIPWFTGTEASFSDTAKPDEVRVTAMGYWAGPCN